MLCTTSRRPWQVSPPRTLEASLVQHAGTTRAEARAPGAATGERAELPAVVAAEVLQHVEVAVAAAHAEVVGVVAVPAVEEVVHLDRVVPEDEAERPGSSLCATLHPNLHPEPLSARRPAPSSAPDSPPTRPRLASHAPRMLIARPMAQLDGKIAF